MKSLLFCLIGLFLSINLVHEKTQACSAYHNGYDGGYGFFGDPGYGHRPYMHMSMHTGGGHPGYGGYGGYGGGYGLGGLMDMFRSSSDIGAGAGSHHQHHPHGRSSLIPISRHRHVHRVQRRSTRHRQHVIYDPHYPNLEPGVGVDLRGPFGNYYLLSVCVHTWIISDLAILLMLMATVFNIIMFYI